MPIDELSETIGRLEANVTWLKDKIEDFLEESDKRYAPMWVKYPVYGLSAGVGFWALQQLLGLINVAKALILLII